MRMVLPGYCRGWVMEEERTTAAVQRWELNALARRLDQQPAAPSLREELVPAPPGSDSDLSPAGRRILEAIEGLPEAEREAFDLVKIQGMTHAGAGQVLGVCVRTVKRGGGDRARDS